MIFVTGANGFVGTELVKELKQKGIPYKAGVRVKKNADEIAYGDLSAQTDWGSFLQGITTIIHLAARVHVMNEQERNPLVAFRNINVDATLKLANAAKEAGVRRFIFISSIKVNGEETKDTPFKANDEIHITDPYGVSKFEAEKELLKLHQPGSFEVVIIRPPLIYGKQVKANFHALFRLVELGLPLPFANVQNKRSFVSVVNLVDLIITCSTHPNAGGKVFLVSDDHDFSLPQLLTAIGKVTRKNTVLFPFPIKLLEIGLALIGKSSFSTRLFGNLQVDIEATKKDLNWKPKVSFEDTFNA